jgi:hypothetical protein
LLRWDLTAEQFPIFKSRPQWYDTHLLKSSDPRPSSSFSYSSQ